MSRYIDAEALDRAFSKLRFNNDGELEHYGDRPNWYLWGSEVENLIADAPSIDLADYVPKDFHDKTCEAMAKAHQEEIADMVSVVRCKECKYKDTYCDYCHELEMDIKADDFCSYGEVRDEYEELGLKELKELINADRKTEPQTDGYMTAKQAEDYRKMLDKAEHKVYGNIEDEPQTEREETMSCQECKWWFTDSLKHGGYCQSLLYNHECRYEPEVDCSWK